MLTQENYWMIKEIQERGLYRTGIASRLGVHLKTATRAVKQGDAPSRRRRGQKYLKLKPYSCKVVRELSTLGFVGRADNVVLLGPPGVGKTHLAIALAAKAAEGGHRIVLMTLEQLKIKLNRARKENRLDRQLQQLTYPKVLILDEIGYLPLSRDDVSLFFRLVARRYERASIILTSNKSFVDWGEIFSDPVLATTILDRLLHHSTTNNIEGESYRLRKKRKAGLLNLPEEPQPAEAG